MSIDSWKKAVLLAQGSSIEEANKEAQITAHGLQLPISNRCPRCQSPMEKVFLITPKRAALFCSKDRVVIPLPVENNI